MRPNNSSNFKWAHAVIQLVQNLLWTLLYDLYMYVEFLQFCQGKEKFNTSFKNSDNHKGKKMNTNFEKLAF